MVRFYAGQAYRLASLRQCYKRYFLTQIKSMLHVVFVLSLLRCSSPQMHVQEQILPT